MSKPREDALEIVQLCIELLKRIPRDRNISAKELHQQLEGIGLSRDMRTIQRHLSDLSDKFDIERDDRNRPYGYRWKKAAVGLALPHLSRQESLLLQLAEQHLRPLLPAGMHHSLEALFEQARRNLHDKQGGQHEKEWLKKVRVVSASQPVTPPKINPGILDDVSQALYQNLWIDIDYTGLSGHRSRSRFMPLALVQQGPRLYLVGRHEKYPDSTRTLPLHRIEKVSVSTLTFKRPEDFDLDRFEAEGGFSYGPRRPITLIFEIRADAGIYVEEAPLSKDQQIEKLPDGYWRVTASVIDSWFLDRWLRGFGDEIRNVSKQPRAVANDQQANVTV